MKKRMLSLLCVLTLLAAALPSAAALQGDAARAADALATLGLIEASASGDYKLSAPATRAQAVVLLVGIYQVMVKLGLTDSILGLIFINAAFNQAFTIWLLRGTFMGISAEMEQAATIDGCTRVQSMMRVLLPVAAPGIVTTLIFIFINAWNEYTVALCLISTDTLKPLTVGINIFNGYNIIEWQYLFAASIFAIIPVVILFMCIEKNLVSGLASGGVKG